MKLVRFFSLLVVVRSALAAFPHDRAKQGTQVAGIVPNRFIVEFEDESSFGALGRRTAHGSLYDSLKSRDVQFEVDKEYRSEVFDGVALTLQKPEDVQELKSLPGIKAILPVRNYPRPTPARWESVKENSTPDVQSTHVMTGVDKLHAEGILGNGISIAILDTGIDYTHPALGGGFGAGFKVAKGYDFVGDAYNGGNLPVPDDDPLDQCAGHGTHVAGIIAADPSNPFDISGVAYEASISAYRIFGCGGSVNDDVIIDALLRGDQDGNDILSLSLGGPDGWTEGAASVVASRLARKGRVVVIAAGNSGASGAWFTSGPANGIDTISVASVDNIAIRLQNATVSGVDYPPITYFSTFPWGVEGSLPIYAISNSTAIVDDACSPLPESTPDLSGYLVLIRRGSCPFVQKLENAAAYGMQRALIYDNGNGFTAIGVGEYNATLIQSFDGEFLVKQLAAGANIRITFPQSGGSHDFPNPSGGLMSSFSTYGPTNDMYFKPSVAAPGGSILSTLPVPLGSYGVASGTSMATPFVAGAAALYLQKKGKESARELRSVFEATSKSIPESHNSTSLPQTLAQQGAGLINVYDAIYSKVKVSPTQLLLNDTANFKGVHTITIKNTDTTPKTYTLAHVAAGTALTFDAESEYPIPGPVPLVSQSATVKLSANSITLQAGETKRVRVTLTPPSGLDSRQLPVYSGFITITSGSEVVHVSYLGVASSLKEKNVLDRSTEFFGFATPAMLDSKGDVQTVPTNYTFEGWDWPSTIFRTNFGTANLRIDLQAVKTVIGGLQNRAEPVFTFPDQLRGKKGSFAAVPTVGPLAEYKYIPRNDLEDIRSYFVIDWNSPLFANGTQVPNGLYSVLIRALRVGGDPTNQDDYDSWSSPVVGVQVPNP